MEEGGAVLLQDIAEVLAMAEGATVHVIGHLGVAVCHHPASAATADHQCISVVGRSHHMLMGTGAAAEAKQMKSCPEPSPVLLLTVCVYPLVSTMFVRNASRQHNFLNLDKFL